MLEKYGWDKQWNDAFTSCAALGLEPARVIAAYTRSYQLVTGEGITTARITGKMRYNFLFTAKFPTIGDWVAVETNTDGGPSSIHAVLSRRTKIQRQQASEIGAQVLGANIDGCMIVQSVVGDFNLARLDRYLTVVLNGGVQPIIVLSKADLLSENELTAKTSLITERYPDVNVVPISSVTGSGIAKLQSLLHPQRTYIALGSSGVGKSTLLNVLSDEEMMETSPVRQDDQRGRHTTTHRQMFLLPNGALYVDTPGLRELALFEFEEVETTFQDITAIAEHCQFNDCTHTDEPGCAVQAAIRSGQLPTERLDSYHKILNEMGFEKEKQIMLNKRLSNARKKRKKIHYKDYRRGGVGGVTDIDLKDFVGKIDSDTEQFM